MSDSLIVQPEVQAVELAPGSAALAVSDAAVQSLTLEPVIQEITVTADEYTVELSSPGQQGAQGLSGVVSVTAPIVNSGNTGAAQLSLAIDGNLEVAAGALKVTDTLNAIDKIAFDVTAGQTAGVGQLVWNDTEGTLDLGLKGGNVTLQVGQELNQLVKHADSAGLIEGKVVYLTGSDGNNITVRYAQANSEATSSKSFAVLTESATGGAKAFATTFGLVRGLDTSTLTEGAIVWLSPTVAGGLTTTKPSAPNHAVFVGLCVRSSATQGVVFVNISNGYELDELHDVQLVSPAEGQVLTYSAAGHIWNNQYPQVQPLFSYAGNLQVYAGTTRYYFEAARTITRIRASVGTPSAGAGIFVTLHINGTALASVSIPAGQNTATATLSHAVVAGDYATVSIDSIGSITSGADLTFALTA